MENEPDNRTEQWLQAYARRRREQAGREVELHEATRQMLLDESEREWSETAEPEPETSPAKLSWFSWAWIGAAAAGVMLVAVISKNDSQDNPAGRPMKITKNIPVTGDGNIVEQERASAPPADEVVLGGKKDRVSNPETSRVVRKITPSTTDVAPSASRPAQQPGIANVVGGAPGSAPAAVSDARLAKTFQAVPKVQDSANFYSDPRGFRQDFAPNTRRAVAAKTSEPVLQNFQFERDGMNVLVVDQDGSKYHGEAWVLEEADLAGRDLPADKENEEKGKAARGKNPVLQALPGDWAAKGFWFQVTGTNHTLKQRVVFEGKILNEQAMKPKPSAELPTVKVPGKAQKQLTVSKKIEAMPRLRIQGNAKVGQLRYGVDAHNVLSSRPAKASPAKLDEDSPLPKK